MSEERVAGAPRSQRHREKRRRLAIVGTLLLCAIGFLLYKGVTSAFVYFKTAQQAVTARASLGNSTFQIEGEVVPGSKHVGAQPSEFSFEISSGKVHVLVDNTGVPPQLFGPGVPVVLVGHFVGSTNTFASDQILIKHSNSYIAAHPNRVKASNGSVH
jgi:cytochrome c-type biogenesis protein CcmE